MPTMTATKTEARIARLRLLAAEPVNGVGGNPNEHERTVAAHMLDKLLAKQGARRTAGGRIDRTWYGAKYDHTHKLTTVDIAKLIRTEIALARKLAKQTAKAAPDAIAIPDPIGDMPAQIKISVRSEYYAGGSSIDIRVSNVPLEWGFVPAGRLNRSQYRKYDRSPALNALVDALHDAMNAYNHNNSDIMTDYFDVRFYGAVEVIHPEDAR